MEFEVKEAEVETGYQPAAAAKAPRPPQQLLAGRHRRRSTCPAAPCLLNACASLPAAAAPVLSPCAAPDLTVSLLEVDALSLQPTLAAALAPSSAASSAQQPALQPLPSLPAVSSFERRRRKQSRTLSEVSALQPQPVADSGPRMSDAMLGAISGSAQPQPQQPAAHSASSSSSPHSRLHRPLLAPLAAGAGGAAVSGAPRRSATLTAAASLLPAVRER